MSMSISAKLKIAYLYTLTQQVSEGSSDFDQVTSKEIYNALVKPLKLKKTSVILDVSANPTYTLDILKKEKYKNVTGVSIDKQLVDTLTKEGYTARFEDSNNLSDIDESIDFIYARQAIENSPFPFFTLLEFNRVLKLKGKVYIESVQPNCARNHESHPNHYSILGERMLTNLLLRSGFDIESSNNLESDAIQKSTDTKVTERFYGIVAVKKRPVDIK